jgi:hypothetical protein
MVPFDEGVFENQSLLFAPGRDHLEVEHRVDQVLDPRQLRLPADEVAPESVPQVGRLSDIDHLAGHPSEQVDAGAGRSCLESGPEQVRALTQARSDTRNHLLLLRAR